MSEANKEKTIYFYNKRNKLIENQKVLAKEFNNYCKKYPELLKDKDLQKCKEIVKEYEIQRENKQLSLEKNISKSRSDRSIEYER